MNNQPQPPPAFPQEREKRLSAKRSLWLIALFSCMVFGLGGGFLIGIIGYYDSQNGTKGIDGLRPAFFLLLLFLGFAVGLVLSLKIWRSIDEAARRAHLDAFYWGGSISWMVIAPLFVLPHKVKGFVLPSIENLDMNASQIFGLGIAATIMATLVGYGIAWLYWWATKR